MKVVEVNCRSILNKSKIYGVDYAINPYTGCEHACVYCYAAFMGEYSNHVEPWGSFVDVKVNAPKILERQLRRARGTVLLSSVTDAYQPIEEKYAITRQCLQLLSQSNLNVSILTKSSLVLRDLDLLKAMDCDVGFTLTTLQEDVREVFEPKSSSIKERLRAMKMLAENGVRVWVFFGPVLPFISDREDAIKEVFTTCEKYGASYILVDRLNLYPTVWRRMKKVLLSEYPELVSKYEGVKLRKNYYETKLRTLIQKIADGHEIESGLCF